MKKILPSGRILRCGKIDFFTYEQIGKPKTIINLRGGPDDKTLPATYVQFAISNDIEKYHTTDKQAKPLCILQFFSLTNIEVQVRLWLNEIFKYLEDPKIEFPILFHCTSGKGIDFLLLVNLNLTQMQIALAL